MRNNRNINPRSSQQSQDDYDNSYDDVGSQQNDRYYQEPPKKKSGFGTVLIVFLIIVAVAAGAYFAYKALGHNSSDEEVMAKIVAVTPNYKTIQIPRQSCNDVVTSKKVKNPNRNFFNGMFDSKNHPEYITQTSSKQVCKDTYTESQVLLNYTMQYQVKNVVESMIVQNPPAVNMIIPLSQLQMYVESSASQSGANDDSSAPTAKN